MKDLRRFFQKSVFLSDDDFVWYRYYEEPLIRGEKIQRKITIFKCGLSHFKLSNTIFLQYFLEIECIVDELHVTLTKI